MISVQNLSKIFATKTEQVAAVDDIAFEVASGEMVTLLGPSGCGKTTTLRCVAGLERPDGGCINIEGEEVVNVLKNTFIPPHRRKLGMVFQSYAIWPHMTVFENVSYALEGKKVARAEVRRMTHEALELVQLSDFAERPAPRLSGGQQQRVAIARALVGRPLALLFDEPLSNLDAKLRGEMRTEIRRLQQQVGLTSIYVTHDQSEALAISDWIIVMRGGKIIERGRPSDIYRTPRNLFTAHFIGDTNLIPGTLTNRRSGDKVQIDTPLGPLVGTDPNGNLADGEKVQLSIRLEDMQKCQQDAEQFENKLRGKVTLTTFQGSSMEAELSCGPLELKAVFGRDEQVNPDSEVTLGFSSDVAMVLKEDPLDEELRK